MTAAVGIKAVAVTSGDMPSHSNLSFILKREERNQPWEAAARTKKAERGSKRPWKPLAQRLAYLIDAQLKPGPILSTAHIPAARP